jgi:hypothetical protein
MRVKVRRARSPRPQRALAQPGCSPRMLPNFAEVFLSHLAKFVNLKTFDTRPFFPLLFPFRPPQPRQ